MASTRKLRTLSSRIIDDAPLGIYIEDEAKLFNPLKIPDFMEDEPELYITWIMSQPEYFYLICKEIMGVTLHPMQAVILRNMWNHKFPMLVGSRGMGKSFILAVYAILRILLLKNRKVVICGSGFRQSKIIFNYMEQIIQNSPILRKLIPVDNISHGTDMHKMTFGQSVAMAIPIGTGDRIRGLRANDVIADEFASVPVEIFETVIAGFASVASGPTEQAARLARKKAAKILGFEFEDDKEADRGNQIIISGTAYYSFNHFADYHNKYRKIIKTRGDQKKLEEILGPDTTGFDHKQFCIIRIPVTLLPEGFMDAAQIARAKATVHNGIYQMEYGAVFSADSNGFYKRTLIESCVVKPGVDMSQPTGETIRGDEAMFFPKLRGDKNKQYFMGVDPAMTQDNFSIVILEIDGAFRKIVYCWTTNKADHINKMKLGIVTDNNYYAYCARKIRTIMAKFNITYIAIDAQGGGRAVMEALNDENALNTGEVKLWPIINYEKQQETDGYLGHHIIDVVQFTKEDWTSKSNHGLRKDMEDKVILFPYFDAISIIEAEEQARHAGHDLDDTYEKIVEEIEMLKDELSTITVTQTPATNRERWDTPEKQMPNGKKGRMRKDRYSALLMANMTARTHERTYTTEITVVPGGFAARGAGKDDAGSSFYGGNSIVAQKLNELYR